MAVSPGGQGTVRDSILSGLSHPGNVDSNRAAGMLASNIRYICVPTLSHGAGGHSAPNKRERKKNRTCLVITSLL